MPKTSFCILLAQETAPSQHLVETQSITAE